MSAVGAARSGIAGRGLDWTLRGLLVVLFILAGAMKLTAHPFEIASFAHFGYPTWFMLAIGAVELAGGLALLHARLVLPSAALLAAVLLGAVVSHMRVGDPPEAVLPAVVALAILVAVAAMHLPGRTR